MVIRWAMLYNTEFLSLAREGNNGNNYIYNIIYIYITQRV